MSTRFDVSNDEEQRETGGLGLRVVKQKLIQGVWIDQPRRVMRNGVEVERRGMEILSPDSVTGIVDADTRFIIEEATEVRPYPSCCGATRQ